MASKKLIRTRLDRQRPHSLDLLHDFSMVVLTMSTQLSNSVDSYDTISAPKAIGLGALVISIILPRGSHRTNKKETDLPFLIYVRIKSEA